MQSVEGFDRIFNSQLTLSAKERSNIQNLAVEYGVEGIDLGQLTAEQLQEFYQLHAPKLEQQAALLSQLKAVGQTPLNRYECEYRSGNYAFWCPLFDPKVLRTILEPNSIPESGLIVDVGCGVGDLLEHLCTQLHFDRLRCLGLDISKAAISKLREKGFAAHAHTLIDTQHAQLLLPDSISLLLLSYFIDRDDNQRGTFASAAEFVASGGKVVLEGLFPVKAADSLGTNYASNDSALITKGVSAADDVRLVIEHLRQSGFTLERLAIGERLVFSLDGFERLSSCFLTFNKE